MMTHTSTTRQRGQGQPPRRYTASEWVSGYLAWIVTLPIYLALWLFSLGVHKLPTRLHLALIDKFKAHTLTNHVDVRIPADPGAVPYMLRWWYIKRNAFFNIYFHDIKRSDEDAALHDHPWWSFSIVLEGGYYEHEIMKGGVHKKTWYGPGSVRFRRSGSFAHRLELELSEHVREDRQLHEKPAKTIFITGPALRRWGFHHKKQWVDAYDWDQYCAEQGVVTLRMAGYAEQNKKD